MEEKDKRIGWLRELKEGDKVIVSGTYRTVIKTIDKITPTGRINIGGIQYDYSGYEINPGSWNKDSLIEWTQEKENEIIKQTKFTNMCNKLREVNWIECSYEFVEKAFLLLEENKYEIYKNRM
jgi:DNA replicative helicase MCM subunit Mcm2 (Cdc46/Mcm family)